MDKKKIVFISTSEISIRSFLTDHIKELKSKRVEIYLITNFNFQEKLFKKLNVSLINIKFKRNINLFTDFYCLLRLFLLFVKIKPDVTISISPKAGLLSCIASFFLNIKIRVHIFTGQVWANKNGIFKNLLMFLDKIVINLNTHILADSKSQKDFLLKNKLIKKKSKCLVIDNGSIRGVDIIKFKKDLSMKLSMRKKLNIEKKSIVLTYVGRLNSEKGVLNLLNTFKKITITKKNVYLLLIGPDEMNIKKMINNNIFSKKLIILDYQKNINFFLQASDIFCFPSEREGFGLSVIEASACELPVVCSNIYGLRDTIVHNYTGYKFRLNNNLEMYNYLIRLIQDKNKRIRLGSQGRDFVKNFYEKKKIILAYSIFFKKLIFRNEIK